MSGKDTLGWAQEAMETIRRKAMTPQEIAAEKAREKRRDEFTAQLETVTKHLDKVSDPLHLVMTVADVVAEYNVLPRTVQLAFKADPTIGRKSGGTLLLRRHRVEKIWAHVRKQSVDNRERVDP